MTKWSEIKKQKKHVEFEENIIKEIYQILAYESHSTPIADVARRVFNHVKRALYENTKAE